MANDEPKDFRWTRRQFELGLVGVGAALAGACHDYRPACPHDRNPDDVLGGYQPVALSRDQCLTVAAAAEAMIAACPPVISAVEIAVRADRLVARMPPATIRNVRLALEVTKSLGFAELDLEDRRRALRKAVASRGIPRDVTRVLKLLTVGPYYSHSEARRTIGYVDFEQRPRFNPLPQYTARPKYPEPAEFG